MLITIDEEEIIEYCKKKGWGFGRIVRRLVTHVFRNDKPFCNIQGLILKQTSVLSDTRKPLCMRCLRAITIYILENET